MSEQTAGSGRDYKPVSLLENVKHLDVELCLLEGSPDGMSSAPRCNIKNLEDATNLESLTFKVHLHAVDEVGNLGKPPEELWPFTRFAFRSKCHPNLRHLELGSFYIENDRIILCLTTSQPSLQSVIFRHCLSQSTLAEIFVQLRKLKLVPSVAIFEQCQEVVDLSDRLKQPILSEFDVTLYPIHLGMKETLCLHSRDEQIEAYWNSTTRRSRR
ncbi:hypothetical protein VE03_01410 [Pseudogymnoascus sp. 23342-1-I1]|nr:hypothetical protein VE03_01410 [Pseudogymnoascus sp. 23342-1-I1]